ncbi:antitoxin Xre-like helix-turn-helix domain-containing protein [Ketobacter sp.]|uniref:antitoxin Xre-like helix-turn-helix domain-containing protein n=1 Tax=Ketobacter sp. TaxID=2083498 RepID=UPI0025BD3D29|nr:antitoxin Xre-like helix-turn-helix domain-containing protein [Ketobacter sp.]
MYNQDDVTARRGIAQLALKGFFNLAARWQLTRPEAMTLLGLTATSTYANWKNGKTGTIPRDTLERISYLFRIDEILRHACPTDTAIIQYLRQPSSRDNPADSLMQRMLQGNVIDIYLVQQSLTQQGQWAKKYMV